MTEASSYSTAKKLQLQRWAVCGVLPLKLRTVSQYLIKHHSIEAELAGPVLRPGS